ncbi:hypothetical protein HK102_005819, partial [Quaeritorhiza haematococci]
LGASVDDTDVWLAGKNGFIVGSIVFLASIFPSVIIELFKFIVFNISVSAFVLSHYAGTLAVGAFQATVAALLLHQDVALVVRASIPAFAIISTYVLVGIFAQVVGPTLNILLRIAFVAAAGAAFAAVYGLNVQSGAVAGAFVGAMSPMGVSTM